MSVYLSVSGLDLEDLDVSGMTFNFKINFENDLSFFPEQLLQGLVS